MPNPRRLSAETPAEEPRPTLGQIFRQYGPAYRRAHAGQLTRGTAGPGLAGTLPHRALGHAVDLGRVTFLYRKSHTRRDRRMTLTADAFTS